MSTGTPLPPVLPIANAPQLWTSAYASCLSYEHAASDIASLGRWTDVIAARLLGYLIIHAPIATGRDNICREINDCQNVHQDLNRLAVLYRDCFVRCFRRAKGPTPAPSPHPSRPSFDNEREMLRYLMEEAPKDHTTAKKLAFIRDGYRCMLTGQYEATSWGTPHVPATAMVTATNFAHIFPASTNSDISGDNEFGQKYHYAAGVWAVMERLGGVLFGDELNGSDIHRLENGLTLDQAKHSFFDMLMLWLEETGVPNQYRPCAVSPQFLGGIPALVTFISPNSKSLPLPSPKYLRLHAACAKVAHLSGVGECINNIFRDMEGLSVLANDGASIEVLHAALMAAS
ncbi:hypothetical protein C8J56DRAFT_375615 [Mycena floridula]|nr:hypothetical protein C8J56DRAFT_375615 [Mycena floridula]